MLLANYLYTNICKLINEGYIEKDERCTITERVRDGILELRSLKLSIERSLKVYEGGKSDSRLEGLMSVAPASGETRRH